MMFFAFCAADPRARATVTTALQASGAGASVTAVGNWVVSGTTVGEPAGAPGLFVIEADRELSAHARQELVRVATSDPNLSRLAEVPGDIGFAYVTERAPAVFVRAAVGTVPLYVWSKNGQLACAASLTALARFLPEPLELDPFVAAVFSSMFGWFPNRRTFLRDVQAVSFGEAAFASATAFRFTRWWDPSWVAPALPSRAARREHAQRLLDALVRNLSRSVPEDGSGLFTFSGGVDSSALVALTTGMLGRTISTLSFVPPQEPDQSVARGYIRSVLSLHPERVRRQWEFVHSPEARLLYLAEVPPVVYPVLNPALCVMSSIQREAEISALLGGEFADDFFGSHLTYEDLDLSLTGMAFVLHLAELPDGVRGVVRHFRRIHRHRTARARLLRPEELPEFVRPELRLEYQQLLADERQALALDPRPRVYLAKRLEATQTPVAQNWEVLSALGVRRAYPFFTRETVELAFATHPLESMGPGTKQMLRLGLRGLVPARNLERPDKHNWREHPGLVPLGVSRLPVPAESVIRPDWLQRAPFEVPTYDALRLRLVLNIVEALSNARNGPGCAKA